MPPDSVDSLRILSSSPRRRGSTGPARFLDPGSGSGMTRCRESQQGSFSPSTMFSRYAALLLLFASGFAAAQPAVEGRITSGGDAVPFATVRVLGTTLGTSADADGTYRLVLPLVGNY